MKRIYQNKKISLPGCFDKCRTEQSHQCQNNGRCKNMYTRTECDCRGTGYTGKTCQLSKPMKRKFIVSQEHIF